MSSVAALADERTVIVQMVAFSEPSWQLPRYLETMEEAGLTEVFLPALQGERDGRLWRSVPSRRWYSDQRGETPGSQEVVLIHRKRNAALCSLAGNRRQRFVVAGDLRQAVDERQQERRDRARHLGHHVVHVLPLRLFLFLVDRPSPRACALQGRGG